MNSFELIAEAFAVMQKRPEEAAFLLTAAFFRLLSLVCWSIVLISFLLVFCWSISQAFNLAGALWLL